MAEKRTKPVVLYELREGADACIYASVPQFGIEFGEWCVGGIFDEDPYGAALNDLTLKIGVRCVEILHGGHATDEQRVLARQIARQAPHGHHVVDFDLVKIEVEARPSPFQSAR